MLRNKDARGHGDAEHGTQQQELHDIGVVGGSERRSAQISADPYRIDAAIERLQDIAGEDGQHETEQSPWDGASSKAVGGLHLGARTGG